MPKNQDFGFQCGPRPEQSDQDAPHQSAEIRHQKQISTDSRALVSRFRFAVGTTVPECALAVTRQASPAHEIDADPSCPVILMVVDPGEELRQAVDLVVMATVGELHDLSAEVSKPRSLLGQIYLSGFDLG